jgi:hypothetical protein
MAGDLHGDVFNGGFVDLDPGPGFFDFNCEPFTYNGHAGIDTGIRSFGEQDIGVPVYAALGGRVIFAQDGWPDKNTNGGEQGNIVGIDHGAGRTTWYYHLKRDSVAVSVGEDVVPGQPVGMVGSSGNSYGPHLHFQSEDGGVPVEVFAGPCRPGASGWRDQDPLHNHDLYLTDFATTEVDLQEVAGLPYEMPRGGQIAMDDPFIRFWLSGVNLPVESDWRVRFYRPDDSLAWDSGWFFFNEEVWRTYWFWWEYDWQEIGPVLGTWHVLVEFSGEELIRAPFEVRPARTPDFNRPPAPISVVFDPPAPSSRDVIFARVQSPLLLDDLDYDIVRYHYAWTVNDGVVRDVVSAGRSDALAVGMADAGDVVRCAVTPNDGQVDGAGDARAVEVALPADLDRDRDVDLVDYALLGLCFGGADQPPGSSCPAGVDADFDIDGDVDTADYRTLAESLTGPR